MVPITCTRSGKGRAVETIPSSRDLLSLEELTARVGLSVRTVRFYTTRGLVPPPLRRGRSGYYTSEHVARLELVRELQGHGFTLSAIERYLARIPADASPADIALHRTMLAPWQSEAPVEMIRAELERRAGRRLADADLETLAALGIAVPTGRGRLRVTTSQLSVGTGLLDLGVPTEAAREAAAIYADHGRAVSRELHALFRTVVWPRYKESGAGPDQLREVVERLKPLSIASLVQAYEAAMDETRREGIARRTQ